ncbi:hypothetical protein LOAG_17047 [Loa loa]|uniref:Uncharacterized protein n=1 Tax=Loa loa TaxID=7209 RepID=A0A1S0UKK0_LOALO|nr:hypothetical protein LOAG_17047 [Loa loa]EJD75898.1 hypothetical protein LOAG_17047 [Loa loa]
MSATTMLSAQPAKEKVEDLPQEQHEARKRIIEEKILRLKLPIGTHETVNTNWIKCIQQVPITKKQQEEENYAQMVKEGGKLCPNGQR